MTQKPIEPLVLVTRERLINLGDYAHEKLVISMYAAGKEEYLTNACDRLCSILNDEEQKAYKNHKEQEAKRREEERLRYLEEQAQAQALMRKQEAAVLDVLNYQPDKVTEEQIADAADLTPYDVQQALYRLEQRGAIETKSAKCRRRWEIVKTE